MISGTYTRGFYFYPRPPRGGRQFAVLTPAADSSISIHALREEGDCHLDRVFQGFEGFLSTPSARRATYLPDTVEQAEQISIHALREEGDRVGALAAADMQISIHALREEGDCGQCTGCRLRKHFYPRPPRGGRLIWHFAKKLLRIFLSTPSARRATKPFSKRNCISQISIHALREEGDQVSATAEQTTRYFYPRPPRGGRRGQQRDGANPKEFLSTPSARRATAFRDS